MSAFGWVKNFLGNSNILGVDIGTASIKMVEVDVGADRPRLLNYGILANFGHFSRANEVIQTSTMKLFNKEVVQLLNFLIKEVKPKTKRVVASLPLFASFVTLLELPDMSDAEVLQTIKYQAQQYIPMPLEQVTLDWLPVGKRQKDGKTVRQILLVSVPTERIEGYKKIFKEAGLNLVALEVEGLSTIRSVVGNDPTPTVVMDIGSHSTGIIITEGGFWKESNQIDYAGNHLTHALSKGLNINLRRAEDLKKQKGLLGSGGGFELSTIMVPFVDVILKEGMRVKNSFETKYGVKIERLVLAGSGANLPGLVQYAGKQTGLVTALANPLLGFDYDKELDPIAKSLGPTLSVGLGLAMRDLT